uniref:Uncharacterized protein n=1 Tax=Ailuropoda melanoleuca TaxID=9646 RepID=A0A7N5JHV5_AILME
IRILFSMNFFSNIYMCVYIYICTHTYIHIHIYMYIYTHTHTYICLIWLQISIFSFMDRCMYLHLNFIYLCDRETASERGNTAGEWERKKQFLLSMGLNEKQKMHK